jgi:hypothetical protein
MIALLFKKGRELADDGGGITERNPKKKKGGFAQHRPSSKERFHSHRALNLLIRRRWCDVTKDVFYTGMLLAVSKFLFCALVVVTFFSPEGRLVTQET